MLKPMVGFLEFDTIRKHDNLASKYMFKDNNRNTRAKLTKQTPERRHWRHSTVFIS